MPSPPPLRLRLFMQRNHDQLWLHFIFLRLQQHLLQFFQLQLQPLRLSELHPQRLLRLRKLCRIPLLYRPLRPGGELRKLLLPLAAQLLRMR